MKELKAKTPMDGPTILGALFIVVATVLVYLPAIGGGFIWDDPDYVVNNHTLRDLSGLWEMWTNPRSIPQWYPLVHTTFWIEYNLWQLNPIGYHLVNVLLHATAALLLWRLLRMLKVSGAWLAGAIFALHPVHVESVAWITERKNVLSGVLALLATLQYLRYHEKASQQTRAFDVDRHYVIALLLFVAALLSKSVTATLPGVLAVIIWWKHGSLKMRDLVPLIPFVVIGAASGLHTAYLETHFVGASSERIVELDLTIVDRFLLAGRIVWFYFTKLILPWPLVFIYPQWPKPDPAMWWQWMFPIGVILGLVTLVLSAPRLGRGPAAGALVFCGALFPALGFLNVYPMRFSYVADHFQYHASMGLIALVAAGLWRLGKPAVVVLIPLAVLTALRTPVYHSAETLWLDTIAKNPNSWMVNTNLAHIYRSRGETTGDEAWFDKADALYTRALELAPHIHDTHANVGMAYGRRGEYDKALQHLEAALKINSHFAPAYYSIGLVYQNQGRMDLAMESYFKALEILPNYAEANYRMGLILERQGNLPAAVERYRVAVTYSPDHADARYNLATCLIRLQQYGEAAGNLLGAVRVRPDWAEAWVNLGATQMALGRKADAIRSLERALQLKPDLPQARLALDRARRM